MEEDTRPRYLSRQQALILAVVAFGNFSTSACYTATAPFFPIEAENKGATLTEIGLMFGTYELICSLGGWIWGPRVPKLGSKFLISFGLLIYGIFSVLFGLVKLAPDGVSFVLVALGVRLADAIGASAYVTGTLAELARSFPGREARTMAIFELANGVGYAVGPVVGGFLYEIAGFSLPIFVTGSCVILAFLVSLCALEKQEESSQQKHKSRMFDLIKICPIIAVCAMACTCIFMSSMQIPTLAPHLKTFGAGPSEVGLILLLATGMYACCAPIWGYVADKSKRPLLVISFGAAFAGFALLMVGPSPILPPFLRSMRFIAVGWAIAGVAAAAAYIPTFQTALLFARGYGMPDNVGTYGSVSGLMQSSVAFGAFLGPTFGSMAVENFGYEFSCSCMAVIMWILAIIIFVIQCRLGQMLPVPSDT